MWRVYYNDGTVIELSGEYFVGTPQAAKHLASIVMDPLHHSGFHSIERVYLESEAP